MNWDLSVSWTRITRTKTQKLKKKKKKKKQKKTKQNKENKTKKKYKTKQNKNKNKKKQKQKQKKKKTKTKQNKTKTKTKTKNKKQKNKTLTPISCTPFSSSSSSKLCFIRREFLSSTQIQRPRCSRNNHRKRKLGLLQSQSLQFLIQASLDSCSILVVVTVVTFSAVFVFFLNCYRRKNNDSEVYRIWIIYAFEFFALNSLLYTKLM